jgi:hypothetical protein
VEPPHLAGHPVLASLTLSLACWLQFGHGRPSVGGDIGMDDLGRLGRKAWQLSDCRLKVAGAEWASPAAAARNASTRKYLERLHQEAHSRTTLPGKPSHPSFVTT